MSTRNYLDQPEPVMTGPCLRERLGPGTPAINHEPVVDRLRRFRERLEREMAPEAWRALSGPMVLTISDVCDALGLNEQERAYVLGRQGERFLVQWSKSRPTLLPENPLNDRQAKALQYVQNRGKINLGAYRKLCPGFSRETLRRDLADLVSREILARNGRNKGTYYTRAA